MELYGMLPRSNILVQLLTSNQSLDYRKYMMEVKTRRPLEKMTQKPDICTEQGERRCEDGSCIPRIELCPEEQLMNQNTILIMIVVGLAVVVFLVILYCFQQRQRRLNRTLFGDGNTGLTDECDNASLYAPPPSYEDVMNTNLYPPTPQQRRLQLSSTEEPMTPPPNYDTALIILAQSQDSVLIKSRRQSSVFRRSVSLEQVNSAPPSGQTTPIEMPEENNSSFNNSGSKIKSFFRFSRHFSWKNENSQAQQQQQLQQLQGQRNNNRRHSHRMSLLQRQNSQQRQQRSQLLRQSSVDQSLLQRPNSERHSELITQELSAEQQAQVVSQNVADDSLLQRLSPRRLSISHEQDQNSQSEHVSVSMPDSNILEIKDRTPESVA